MSDSTAGLLINRRNVIQNILALFSGSAIGQGAIALTLFLMARSLGPEAFGQYTSAVTLTSFIGVAFNLGLDLWLLHEGGREPHKIGNLAGSVLVLRLVIGLIWFSSFFLLAPAIESATFSLPLLRLGAFLAWLNSMFYSLLTAFKAVLKNKLSAVQEAAFNLTILGATLGLIIWQIETAQNFLISRIGIQIVFLIVCLILVNYWFGLRPEKRIIRQALTQFPPYLSSDILAALFMRMDILMVAFILTKKDVGLYSPAAGLINALFLVPAAIYTVIVPVLSHQFKHDIKQAWHTVKNSILVLAAVGLVLFIGVIIFAEWVVVLLGPAYQGVQPLLLLLSPIILLHSLTYGVATVLVANKLQAKRSVVQALAVGTDLLCNLILLPRIGIPGAAIAYLISEIVVLGGYSWLVYQTYRRHQRENSL